MANTGYIHYTNRVQYMLDPATGLIDLTNPTGVTEPNTAGPNYVPDELDYDTCPLGELITMSYLPIWTSSASACSSASSSANYRHNGASPTITNGDRIYTDNAMTTYFVGTAGRYYKNYTSNKWMQVSSLGIVTSNGGC